jgi:cellulose synthase (UDP-forming)
MWRVHVRLRGVRVHWFRWVGLLHLIAGVAYLYWRITEG